jgi:hypothetical protein
MERRKRRNGINGYSISIITITTIRVMIMSLKHTMMEKTNNE